MPRRPWDRTSENALWSASEALIVIAVGSGMMAMAAQSVPVVVARFQFVEAHSLIAGVRADLQQAYAVTGEWPVAAQATFTKNTKQGHISDVAFGPAGVVTFAVSSSTTRGRGTQVSYRPAHASTIGSAIVWTCGYAEPPPGFSLAGSNRSDVDPPLLPASCRNTTVRN
jgi:type II secretory pathway pseudopilin PulG